MYYKVKWGHNCNFIIFKTSLLNFFGTSVNTFFYLCVTLNCSFYIILIYSLLFFFFISLQRIFLFLFNKVCYLRYLYIDLFFYWTIYLINSFVLFRWKVTWTFNAVLLIDIVVQLCMLIITILNKARLLIAITVFDAINCNYLQRKVFAQRILRITVTSGLATSLQGLIIFFQQNHKI